MMLEIPALASQPVHGGYPGEVPQSRGDCHYCGLAIGSKERALESNNTPGVWAHVTCWYDGGPFERDMQEKGLR